MASLAGPSAIIGRRGLQASSRGRGVAGNGLFLFLEEEEINSCKLIIIRCEAGVHCVLRRRRRGLSGWGIFFSSLR